MGSSMTEGLVKGLLLSHLKNKGKEDHLKKRHLTAEPFEIESKKEGLVELLAH